MLLKLLWTLLGCTITYWYILVLLFYAATIATTPNVSYEEVKISSNRQAFHAHSNPNN